MKTDEWTALGITWQVRRQVKRGKPVNNWYVQFCRPAPHYGRWRVGSAKGGFESQKQAEAWVLALRRLGETPWVNVSALD